MPVVQAQDPVIAARMMERLPAVDQLLLSGQVGENNRGLLEPRQALGDEQRKLVMAENADRQMVYAAIAERTNQPPAVVARNRAHQIRERAAKGVWLQDADGKWFRK